MNRKGFTLIELLVVIAIIAILAAILFPVFAQAREKARAISCASNLKQIGTATLMYTQDYDELFYPHRWSVNAGLPGVPALPAGTNPFCAQYSCAAALGTETGSQITGAASGRVFWVSLLQTYTKNYGVFMCPDNPNAWVGTDLNKATNCGGGSGSTQTSGCDGIGYGGENSYAHNDFWMSPAAPNTVGGAPVAVPSNAQISRPSNTVIIVDGTYYGAGPDLFDESGLNINYNGTSATVAAVPGGGPGSLIQADQNYVGNSSTTGQGTKGYPAYWQNVGNGNFGYALNNGAWVGNGSGAAALTTAQQGSALNFGASRHGGGLINCQFADGHVKAVHYNDLISNMCYWVLDAPIHPAKTVAITAVPGQINNTNPSHQAYCN